MKLDINLTLLTTLVSALEDQIKQAKGNPNKNEAFLEYAKATGLLASVINESSALSKEVSIIMNQHLASDLPAGAEDFFTALLKGAAVKGKNN